MRSIAAQADPLPRPSGWGRSIRHLLALGLFISVLSGCSSQAVISNSPHTSTPTRATYSLADVYGKRPDNDVSIILSFSGGGTRAAALAYGVLLELRDTQATINGKRRRLLDGVNVISAVSGGSFTAAYYGLFGDRIFSDFEERFLRKDVESHLVRGLLDPMRWFSSKGRTEMATDFYRSSIFGGATFADMRRRDAPIVLINASDLSTGARITFVQEYFNLLCSDIDDYPVARAVTASSAVPVLFDPVVMENYRTCDTEAFVEELERSRRQTDSTQVIHAAKQLEKIVKDKMTVHYLHLVDGGITDNLGLRSLYEIVELYGGVKAFVEQMGSRHVRKSALIVVDASTDASYGIAETSAEPSIEQTVNAVSDIQLHRYNASTLELMRQSIQRWNRELYAPGKKVDSYFIEVSLRDLMPKERQRTFNQIPTSFTLTDQQVDELISAGRELLRNNRHFQELVHSFNRNARR